MRSNICESSNRHLIRIYKKLFVSSCLAKQIESDKFPVTNSMRVFQLASNAAHNFRLSYEKYLEISKSRARGDYFEGDEQYEGRSIYEKNPGRFGEILTNLDVMEHILKASDMVETKKQQFFAILRKDKNAIDLRLLFPEMSSWEGMLDFLINLQERSQYLLTSICKQISYYSDDHLSNIQDITFMMNRYHLVFKSAGIWMRNVDESDLSSLAIQRKHLTMNMAHDFGWIGLIRSVRRNIVSDLSLVLDKMKRISDLHGGHGLTIDDKVAYINVAFAKVHRKMDYSHVDFNALKKFISELVTSDIDNHPEPFYFYIMLNWPRPDEPNPDLHLIRQCIKKLVMFEEDLPGTGYERKERKSPPHFFLRAFEDNIDQVIPTSQFENGEKKDKRQLRLRGKFNRNKNVVITFRNGDSLTLPAASLHNRRKNFEDVSFSLGFTFSGPKAYHTDDGMSEREKLKNLENNALLPDESDDF